MTSFLRPEPIPEPAGFKWCSECGDVKRLDEFYKQKIRAFGRWVEKPRTQCKECMKRKQR